MVEKPHGKENVLSEPILVDDEITPADGTKEIVKKNVTFVPSTYELNLPFLGNFNKKMLDKEFEKFRGLLGTVNVTFSFTICYSIVPYR